MPGRDRYLDGLLGCPFTIIEQATETGFAPPHESYSRYYDLHLLVGVLSFFSIIAFLVQLWLLSNGSIYIPESLIPSPN
jgi:hypothetical protein